MARGFAPPAAAAKVESPRMLIRSIGSICTAIFRLIRLLGRLLRCRQAQYVNGATFGRTGARMRTRRSFHCAKLYAIFARWPR